jgi:chemotaxis protein CheC
VESNNFNAIPLQFPVIPSDNSFGKEREMSGTYVPLDEVQKDVLREIANIGAGHSMRALSEMTNETFILSVPEISFRYLSDYPMGFGDFESIATAIYMPVHGGAPGHTAYIFPYASSCKLAALLLKKDHKEVQTLEEMECSALCEVGNIVISSFLNAISEFTGISFKATPPAIAVDMTGAIISSILSITSQEDTHVLSVMTRLEDAKNPLDGYFLYVPEPSALPELFKSLGMEY